MEFTVTSRHQISILLHVCKLLRGDLQGAGGGSKITSFHPWSKLERLISIIYRGTYSSKRLSDSTKVTAGERQKIWLEK